LDADGSFDVQPLGNGDFRVVGELDLATADRLLEVIHPAMETPSDVTLDLGNVTFLDSSGIRALIEAGREAATHGKIVILRSPSRAVLVVLDIVGAERFVGIAIEGSIAL